MKLTAALVRNYRLKPGETEKIVSDDDLQNFYVRFRRSGSHAYSIAYRLNGKKKWFKIADVGRVSLEQARAAARERLAQIALGADPIAEKTAARVAAQYTFGSLIESYIAFKSKSRRASTVDEAERYLANRATSLHAFPVKEIDRAMVSTLLNKVEAEYGPGARNNTRAYVRAFFTWLRKEGYVETNPVVDTNAAEPSSRDHRLLSDEEVTKILTALSAPQRADADFSDIVRLLFLTGLRRDEIAKLEWSEVKLNEAAIIVRGSRMKNRKDHVVPLSDAAMTILKWRLERFDRTNPRTTVFGRRSDTGFSGFSKAKRELDEAVTAANDGKAIEAWVLHDIRRFVSTTLNERLRIEPHIVEVVLAHYPKGVAGTYNRAQYVSEKRCALDRLAAHLETVVTGSPVESKVIRLGKR